MGKPIHPYMVGIHLAVALKWVSCAMRERLEKLVGINESKEMTIGTFHAICARILRVEADYLAPLGLNKSFVIFDTDDQATLIKQAIKALNLDEKQYKPATMQALISR